VIAFTKLYPSIRYRRYVIALRLILQLSVRKIAACLSKSFAHENWEVHASKMDAEKGLANHLGHLYYLFKTLTQKHVQFTPLHTTRLSKNHLITYKTVSPNENTPSTRVAHDLRSL
jgi:hypothetical protein